MMVLAWIILIGFAAGSIARLVMPGPNKPKGFVLTTLIGAAGAMLASVGGEFLGLYQRHMHVGAGLIGATVGAIIILYVWNLLVVLEIIPDHGL